MENKNKMKKKKHFHPVINITVARYIYILTKINKTKNSTNEFNTLQNMKAVAFLRRSLVDPSIKQSGSSKNTI